MKVLSLYCILLLCAYLSQSSIPPWLIAGIILSGYLLICYIFSLIVIAVKGRKARRGLNEQRD